MKHIIKKLSLTLLLSSSLLGLTSCGAPEKKEVQSTTQETSSSETVITKEQTSSSKETPTTTSLTDLANLTYEGTQTIDVNEGIPSFTQEELSLDKGAWENYGDLDKLNRATAANAMLNQSLMPTGERESTSSVTPTGWKNKKIEGGYLFNRSHLIGFALAGENANWKNLITGTRQLNSPEMLRHEMDVKYYLEQSPDNYVRYRVTPVFKDDDLLARGVQMEAQSINSDAIQFNVYIFNVQDGVTLNYADGSSQVETSVATSTQSSSKEAVEAKPDTNTASVFVTPTGKKYHAKAHGRGNFSETSLDDALSRGLEPCDVCY